MGKRSTMYLESDATDEENSYDYIVEWDDNISDYDFEKREIIHKGPDSIIYHRNYDDAWEAYQKLKSDPNFINVRLRRL